MAICNALSGGLSRSCDTNAGGIKRVLVGDYTTLNLVFTGGVVTSAYPSDAPVSISNTATITSTNTGGVWSVTNVIVSGDQTAKFSAGRWISFSFKNTLGSTQYWNGPVSSSSFGSGVTTIIPNFAYSYQPSLGPSTSPQPNNTSNQSLSIYGMFEISTNKNVNSFAENISIDMANGTTFYNQIVTIDLARRETTKREFIDGLVAGQKPLVVIVQDSNGTYWLSGSAEGSYVSAIEGGSGTAKADKNGYSITLTAMEPKQAYEVSASVVSALAL